MPVVERACVLQVAHHEACGVPKLIGEVAARFQLLFVEALIVARRCADGERKAQSVGAVQVDELQRIQHIAARFAHLHAFGVKHKPVQIDRVEGRRVHILYAHHHHPRNPKEQDVVARFHYACGIEVVQILSIVGPAKRGVRPKRRTEPGVQHIRIAHKTARIACGTRRRIFALNDDFGAAFAVPDGDAVSPPELAADAPVADVVHPVEIDFGEAFRDDLRIAVCDSVPCGLGERLHSHIPLLGNDWLDDVVAPIAVSDGVGVRLRPLQQAFGLELAHDVLARFEHALPLIWAGVGVQRSVEVHYADGRQVVALAYLEVRRIVSGRNL